jgi:hypothetical protein
MGHYEDFLNKQLKEKEEDQLRYEQTVQQLKTEERFVNFFKSYEPASVASFIESYARQKVMWLRYSGSFEGYAAKRLQEKRKELVDILANVMEKKVFNLKCRWVAGEMDIEGVEVSADFEGWRTMPTVLEAAGAVTAEEFYCYLDHFKEGGPQRLNRSGMPLDDVPYAIHHYHFARSHGYRQQPEDFISEWFHCYDRHFGTAHLMRLPAVRTDLEADHWDEWARLVHLPSLSPEQQQTLRLTDRATRERLRTDPEFFRQWCEESDRIDADWQEKRPKYEYFHVYDQEIMEEVIRAIEPRETLQTYRNERRWRSLCSSDDVIFTPVEYLKQVKEYVPIASNDDYREAIRETYGAHLHSTHVQALIMLFEEYEDCIRNGQHFDWCGKSRANNAEESRRRILEVRKLKGLPLNFDFLKKENLP